MGLPRSTYYDVASREADDAEIVATIIAICDEFEAYGYRRVGAELRHRGIVVNSKKIRRLMREHDLQPKRRKRFVATTDSDHASPIFPDLARDRMVDGPNQLWVADITYIAIATGFVYMAAILDAWSRRVVGCDQPLDRCPSGCCSPEGSHPASTTQIEVRNMPRRLTATCSPSMGSSAPWAGAGTPTTMPRPRAL